MWSFLFGFLFSVANKSPYTSTCSEVHANSAVDSWCVFALFFSPLANKCPLPCFEVLTNPAVACIATACVLSSANLSLPPSLSLSLSPYPSVRLAPRQGARGGRRFVGSVIHGGQAGASRSGGGNHSRVESLPGEAGTGTIATLLVETLL